MRLMYRMRLRWWYFVHNAVSHPLLGITGGAVWAERFHDWSARRL